MIQRQTQLSANIVAFCRFLREKGFTIGVLEERDALVAIELVQPYVASEMMQLCLQAALCKTPLQLQKFPDLYQQYWRELDKAVDSKIKDAAEEKSKKSRGNRQKPSFQALKNWLYGNQQTEMIETATYSNLKTGQIENFPEFDEAELKEVFRWVKRLIDKIASRRSRRFQSTHQKHQIDLKKTLRQNITRYAEIIKLAYRKKKVSEVNVVLLCDVSRSMELYSRFFIQFMYAFQQLFPKVEAFAFSNELYPISKELTSHSLTKSMQQIIEKVNSWSGGTEIGASLQAFNEQYAFKNLTAKTLVIILSDGWDTGEAELIQAQMQEIHRKALKVLWLNPLAASTDWQPEVTGMKAAMPYVDLLLPFHSLESLEEMVKVLSKKFV